VNKTLQHGGAGDCEFDRSHCVRHQGGGEYCRHYGNCVTAPGGNTLPVTKAWVLSERCMTADGLTFDPSPYSGLYGISPAFLQ
jgi:hypothetical protein